MPHTCSEPGCTSPIFGGGYCKYHGYRRRMEGGDQFKRKPPKKTAIPKESQTRKEEKKYYSLHCKELEAELRSQDPQGRIFCFFTGLEIKERVTFHHLKGRTGKFYTDKAWLVACINKYHLQYHFTSVESLEKDWWYADFLARLKAKDHVCWLKEIRKREKSIFEDD
jgi:hypothetical protein